MAISHPKGNEPCEPLWMEADADMATEARLLQSENALAPMVCNASGKATEAKLLHLENAPSPMVCNASGKATEAKLLHP